MKIDQLTFTRFLAAIPIVAFHFGNQVFPFNEKFLSRYMSFANTGVSYFFILSGFVMIIAYGNQARIQPLDFIKNRLARIYPIYFLALFLSLEFPIHYYNWFLNIFFLEAWIPGKALCLNGPGWSLSVEFFFYMIFPFLFNHFYSKQDSIKKCVVPILAIWILTQAAIHWYRFSPYFHSEVSKINELVFYSPLMHVNEFLIGNLGGLLFIQRLKNKTGNYDWYIIAVLIAILLVFTYSDKLIYHNGLLSVLFVPLLLLLSLNTGKISQLLKSKSLVFLGEISFGLYILQVPIFKLSRNILDVYNLHNHNAVFYLSLFFLLVISILSYISIEVPLRNKIKKLTLYNIRPRMK